MFKEQKFSKFITNNNYNFERERILEILPDDLLNDSFNTISNWENYRPTPLENLNKLSKRLSLKNIFYKDESKRFDLKSFKALVRTI